MPSERFSIKGVIRHLERCTAAGRRQHEVFDDWLELMMAMFSIATPEEAQKTDAKLTARYPKSGKYSQHFGEATRELIKLCELEQYHDFLGEIFMEWGNPNPGNGQFFTPWGLASAMGQMTLGDGRALVHQRLKAAIAQSPAAAAALLTGYIVPKSQALAWYLARVVPPALEHYQPVTVQDPACGSGVLLLAAADQYDWWMVRLGLVQFYGQDIDLTCVQMAMINFRLYGLNGCRAAEVLEWAEGVLSRPAEPVDQAETAEAVEVSSLVGEEVAAPAAAEQLVRVEDVPVLELPPVGVKLKQMAFDL